MPIVMLTEADCDVTAPLQAPNLEDQHVAQRVDCALRETDYWALYAVRVSVRSRVVFLEGRVLSYYLKQLAQETARGVPGTHQICNDLDVVQPTKNNREAFDKRQQSQDKLGDPRDENRSYD